MSVERVVEREASGVLAAPASSDAARRVLQATWAILGSHGLTCTILVLLTILTLAGTLAQVDKSLYDVQAEYFESLIVLARLGPIALPLPGAYALLLLLAANLIVGGLIRIRKGRSTAGVLIVHLGMLLLLLGGLIEYVASDRGNLKLYEGMSSDSYQSVETWELVIEDVRADGGARTWVVPQAQFEGVGPGHTRRLRLDGLNVDLRVADYVRNADIEPEGPRAGHGSPHANPHAEGGPGPTAFRVRRMEPDPEEAGRNIPALRVLLQPGGSGQPAIDGLLWGAQAYPLEAEVQGARLRFGLRRQQFQMPFDIRLEQFVKEDHPGTRMPRRFSSFVSKVEGRVETRIHITMNEPLRHEGYTLYQSGWGPQSEREPPQPYSVFSVVRNPADRIPLWACIVLAAGLLLHFLGKFERYWRAEARRVDGAARGEA